jgi:hypothetical protein
MVGIFLLKLHIFIIDRGLLKLKLAKTIPDNKPISSEAVLPSQDKGGR